MNPLPIQFFNIKVLGKDNRLIYETHIEAWTREIAIKKLLEEYKFDYNIYKDDRIINIQIVQI